MPGCFAARSGGQCCSVRFFPNIFFWCHWQRCKQLWLEVSLHIGQSMCVDNQCRTSGVKPLGSGLSKRHFQVVGVEELMATAPMAPMPFPGETAVSAHEVLGSRSVGVASCITTFLQRNAWVQVFQHNISASVFACCETAPPVRVGPP